MNCQLSVLTYPSRCNNLLSFPTAVEEKTQLKNVIHDAQELIKDKVGVTRFFQLRDQIRGKSIETKQARKRSQALVAAIDPERAISKRQRKHQKQRLSKKRKLQIYTINKNPIKVRKF